MWEVTTFTEMYDMQADCCVANSANSPTPVVTASWKLTGAHYKENQDREGFLDQACKSVWTKYHMLIVS